MGHVQQPSWTSQISLATLVLTCLLFVLLPCTSAFSTRDRRMNGDTVNKRDMYEGLDLQCRFHPRNCPGYQKRSSQFEPSLKDSLADSLVGKDQFQPEAFLTGGAELRNNLIDLLRPVEVYTTEDGDEDW